jgi:hypothetical protein
VAPALGEIPGVEAAPGVTLVPDGIPGAEAERDAIQEPAVIRDAAGADIAARAPGETPAFAEVDNSDAVPEPSGANPDAAEADSSVVNCPETAWVVSDAVALQAARCGTRLVRLDCRWCLPGHREH